MISKNAFGLSYRSSQEFLSILLMLIYESKLEIKGNRQTKSLKESKMYKNKLNLNKLKPNNLHYHMAITAHEHILFHAHSYICNTYAHVNLYTYTSKCSFDTMWMNIL